MEKKTISIILIQGMSAASLLENSKDFPEINALIKGGNTTRLLRRKDTDFLTSILGLSRVEEAKGATLKQTNLEDLYYNVNIKGEYKNLYKGMTPFILTNDPDSTGIIKKYNIPHKVETMNEPLSAKLLAAAEPKSYRPFILHINCDKLSGASKPHRVLELLSDSLKFFLPQYRLYTIFYPFAIDLPDITPAAPNPYVQMVTPPQSYWFYKSDRITDIAIGEAGLAIESNGENCRVDDLESLADLVNKAKVPGGLWMLAEQFMRQVAFYMGYIGKFGA